MTSTRNTSVFSFVQTIALIVLSLFFGRGVAWAEGKWVKIGPEGGGVAVMAIDPVSPSTLYASSAEGVIKSTNGGTSWKLISGSPGGPFALAIDPATPMTIYWGNGGGVFKSTNGGVTWAAANSGLPQVIVTELAIDPTTPTTIYAAAFNPGFFGGAGIFKSTNGGATWAAINNGLTRLDIFAIAIDPVNSSTLYVGTQGAGVFKSTNGGANWTAMNSGLPTPFDFPPTVHTLSIVPAATSTIYAGTDFGVFRSTDAAGTWVPSSTGLPGLAVEDIAINPANAMQLYAWVTSVGVFKSIDGGASWVASNTGLGELLRGRFVLDPVTSSTLYVNSSGGIFKSTNSAGNWASANGGVTNHIVEAIAIDPSAPNTIYAGTFGSGVFKSTDRGMTWASINSGLPSFGVIQALAIDPVTPSTIYAGISGGVFKSTNGGGSWASRNNGLTDFDVRVLAIDPDNPSTTYAGTPAGGVFKSTDGAANWAPRNGGLPDLCIPEIAIDPVNTQTLYAGSCGLGTGVSKSIDGGGTWTAASNGLPSVRVMTLEIDPTNPAIVYAGTAGVFKSVDGGTNWAATPLGGFEPFLPLAIDPAAPTNVYAGGWKSTNSGNSWVPMGTGLTSDVRTLAVDPAVPSRLYAGTRGSSVFMFQPDDDNDGVADEVEAAAPNNGDGNHDGIPDSEQANVASLPNSANGPYVTLASSTGTTLVNVQVQGNPDPPNTPGGIDFPVGFFSFTVQGVTTGGSATVTLFLPPATVVDTYYKFGPTSGNPSPHFYEFLFDGTTGAQFLPGQIVLHFVDGGRGDNDLLANGSIVEPGAPGSHSIIPVVIDIRPGTSPNTINLGSNGIVPVAISSSATFDARAVDSLTVTLAGAPIRLNPQGKPSVWLRDINGDGRLDLVVHVQTELLQLTASSTEAQLTGRTNTGQRIQGVDSVRVVP